MVLTAEQYTELRETLHAKTLVGTPKQKATAEDLRKYFNVWFVNTMDTAKIEEEIKKDIARWVKKDNFNPRFNSKGARMACKEAQDCDKIQELLDDLVAQIKKKMETKK